jgi:hypothetical protein
MKSRTIIEKFCKEHDIEIVSLDYTREYTAVPEELVPVGWVIVCHPVSNKDDVFEYNGSCDDIVWQLNELIDYDDWSDELAGHLFDTCFGEIDERL